MPIGLSELVLSPILIKTAETGPVQISEQMTTIPRKRLPDTRVEAADGNAIAVRPPMPCVVYECSSNLDINRVSSGSFDVIGIQRERILGNRGLWDQRLFAEDRARLLARLEHLERAEVASEIHRIIDDRGLPIWVAHTFQKAQVGNDFEVHGCMVPLPTDFRANVLDSSIISQFVHKIGNHFQLINLLIGSLKRTGTSLDELESLQQTVDRAVDFTRSFSHFSQSIATPATVSLAELLPCVVKSAASSSYEKNVTVSVVVEPTLNDATISGDPFLLEFAFAAVLQNALDATQSGDQVVLSAKRELPMMGKGAVARIAIADTGEGIGKDMLGKISEPFFSLKRDRDGLGLSSAVRIFEIHGGAVNISSVPGRGSEVQVLFPIDD
jgi:signal transduction histidine kinase